MSRTRFLGQICTPMYDTIRVYSDEYPDPAQPLTTTGEELWGMQIIYKSVSTSTICSCIYLVDHDLCEAWFSWRDVGMNRWDGMRHDGGKNNHKKNTAELCTVLFPVVLYQAQWSRYIVRNLSRFCCCCYVRVVLLSPLLWVSLMYNTTSGRWCRCFVLLLFLLLLLSLLLLLLQKIMKARWFFSF